jgi:hypothetical protein
MWATQNGRHLTSFAADAALEAPPDDDQAVNPRDEVRRIHRDEMTNFPRPVSEVRRL